MCGGWGMVGVGGAARATQLEHEGGWRQVSGKHMACRGTRCMISRYLKEAQRSYLFFWQRPYVHVIRCPREIFRIHARPLPILPAGRWYRGCMLRSNSRADALRSGAWVGGPCSRPV